MMLIPIEDKVILRFLSVTISILAVLISTTYALAESRSVPVVSVIRKEVPIPKKSMERLLEIGRSISKENGLEIKRINLEVWYHPIDTLIAVIEFKERFLKDDVYEYVYQPFTNKNWIRGNINRAYYQGEKIKPASIEWAKEGDIIRLKMLKLSINNEILLVEISDTLNGKSAVSYVKKFIDWAKVNPHKFKGEQNHMFELTYSKDKEKVSFKFGSRYSRLRNYAYTFDVSNSNFKCVGGPGC